MDAVIDLKLSQSALQTTLVTTTLQSASIGQELLQIWIQSESGLAGQPSLLEQEEKLTSQRIPFWG